MGLIVANISQGQVGFREKPPGNRKAAGIDFAAVEPALITKLIQKRPFSAGQIRDLMVFLRADAVDDPLAKVIPGKELPLLDFLFGFGEIVVIAIVYILKPMQTANAGILLVDLLQRQLRRFAAQSGETFLVVCLALV